MINFFDKTYTGIVDRYPILSKLRFYSIQRLVIRLLGNILIPIFYILSKKERFSLRTDMSKKSGRLIVSITTFPPRIGRIWITLESILRQTQPPDKIILWLSNKYFESFSDLPSRLLHLQKRGVEIRFVKEDYQAHKKYYYFLQEFKDDILITLDDDIIYPTFLIEKLVEYYKIYPNSIICNRALIIKTKNNQIEPYVKWGLIKESTLPVYNLFQTSGGGTLFPPNVFYEDVLKIELFQNLSFHSDDMWLNCMAQLQNIKTVKTDYYSVCFPVINFRDIHLSTTNVDNGVNDIQMKNLREYYIKNKQIDPYKHLFSNSDLINL